MKGSFRSRPLLSVCLGAALALSAGAWLDGHGQPHPPPEAPVQLHAGAAHDREMKPGDTHRYTIDVGEGECVRARLEMRGMDVKVTVTGPDDRELLVLIGIGVGYGPEPVGFIAPSTGTYRLTVAATEQSTRPGRYQLEVSAVRPPEADDRTYVAAARAYAEATVDGIKRTDESGPRAARGFQEALTAWQASGDRRLEAQTRVALGLIHRHHLYDNPGALAHWQQGVEIWRAIGDEAGEATALLHLSSSLQTLGDLEGTIAARERARDLHHAAGRKAQEASALDSLALVWTRLGEFQRALDYAHAARALFREAGDTRGEAYAVSDIALVYIRIGEWDLAIDRYREVLRIHPDDQQLEAIALVQTGLARFNLGDLEEARTISEQALALARKKRFRLEEGNILSNLLVIYNALGDVAKGIEAGEAALTIFRGASDSDGQAMVNRRLGGLYARRGDAQAARAAYEAAQTLSAGKNPRLEAHVLEGLGRLARDEGRLAEARKYAEGGLALAESLRVRIESQRRRQSLLAGSQPLYELLVDVLMREHAANPTAGHDAAALEVAERARARSLLELLTEGRIDVRTGADPKLLEQERTVRARLNVAAESLVLAQRARGAAAADRAAAIERQIASDTETLAQIELNLRRSSPRYAALTAPPPLSAAALQREVLDADTVLIELMLGEPASYLWVLSPTTLKSYQLPAREEIERAARLVYEASSAPQRVVRDASGRTPVKGMPTSAAAKDAKAATAAAASGSTVPAATVAGSGAAAETTLMSTAAATSSITPEEYERRARALSDLVLGPAASALNARRLVIVAPGLLEYVPFAALPIPAGAAAGRDTPPAESGTGAGASASQAEPRTAAGAARAEPGTAAGAGASQVASRSAIGAASAFEPLISRFEVVTAPSASVVATLRRERAARAMPTKGIVILADPVFDADDPRVARARAAQRTTPHGATAVKGGTDPAAEGAARARGARLSELERAVRSERAAGPDRVAYSRLPFSRLEADAIAAAAPQGTAVKAVDFDATHAFATSPALADFRIVHFATHGVLHARQPDLSGVVLSLVDARGKAQEGFLRLHEIYNLNLNADLVVLSGCQTALGKAVRGEGLVGVTRGFMYAGSPRVIASLWQVDDLATSELMARFYRHLFGGKQEPAAALRAAQLDLARDPRWRAPYYWAAFVLQGDWQSTVPAVAP